MKTDKRADAIFRKRYHLKGKQVNSMRDTMAYQQTVLHLLLGDLWQAIKDAKIGEILFKFWVGLIIGYTIYKLAKGIL